MGAQPQPEDFVWKNITFTERNQNQHAGIIGKSSENYYNNYGGFWAKYVIILFRKMPKMGDIYVGNSL